MQHRNSLRSSCFACCKGNSKDFIKLNGDILSKANVDVVSDKPGKLSRIAVTLGDRIEKGQIIAEVTRPRQKPACICSCKDNNFRYSDKCQRHSRPDSRNRNTDYQCKRKPIEARVLVPERFVGLVKQGAEATVGLDAYPDAEFRFRVTCESCSGQLQGQWM